MSTLRAIQVSVWLDLLVLCAALVAMRWMRRRVEMRGKADAAARLLRGGPTLNCFKCGVSLVGLLPDNGVYYCRCGIGYTRETG